MANNQASEESLSPIDNDLFHAYTRYQLCQLKKSTSLWTCSQEKEAMLNILAQFENIDGNTLRMVVNQIFENSTVTHDVDDGTNSESSLGYPGASTITSTHHFENVPSSPTSSVSTEASNSDAIDRTWSTSTITSSRKRSHRPAPTQEIPIAKKSKMMHDSIIGKLKLIISKPNMEELSDMTQHVERSKHVILARMRRVKSSFKLKASAPTAQYSLHISTPFGDPREPMSMCQSNLIAYQFGKLLDQGHFDYNNRKNLKAETECYLAIREEMHAHGQRIATPVHKYARYALNVVKTADKIGPYALFIPEILSPYTLQVVSRNNFPVLKKCMDAKCAGFKKIARFDHGANLIIAELDYANTHDDKSYRLTKSKLLNASA